MHHFVRRFLEPVQDVIVVLLAVALFAVMTRALITIGSDILASRMVYRDVISQALFVLVLMEVERLLIIYLRDHHVSVDVMVEATIVGALREAMLLIAVGVEPQRLLALTAFVVALAVILRLGDLRATAGRVRVHGARQREGARRARRQ
ncbi:MAG TPA: phosphate-starvation-inducible PsiE family protein [Gemmatimonadaceae bacterium]|nr:phosphate-starvation-inducible PsiE family protein [Gemmatimonadaceae bacterium]